MKEKIKVLTEEEYKKIITRVEKGEVLIGIEPALARQFFTSGISTQKIQEMVGEPIYLERLLATTILILEPIFLLLNFVATIFLFKWYSIAIIPITFIVWVFLGGRASMGKQGIIFPIVILLIGFFMAYYFKGWGIWFQSWVIFLGAIYFLPKLKYWLSVFFARLLACRNYKFFSQFLDTMIILKE